MTFLHSIRRAAPLGVAFVAMACDVVQFASDPKPQFEQTWNLPTAGTSISVASVLPTNVQIYSTPASNPPDSSAFIVNINNVVFASALAGASCPGGCAPYNGTTQNKPPFVLTAVGSSTLPVDVVSAAVLGATINYSIVNNLTFDPIRVNTGSGLPTQGYFIITVRSGSLVLGRDSVSGTSTAWPPAPAVGSTVSGSIPIATGVVTGAMTVDLQLNSPQGDHPVPINTARTINTTATVANFRAANVRINVPNKTVNNAPDTLDLKDLDKSITDHVIAGALEMSINNPWPASGNLNVDFKYNATQSVAKTVAFPGATIPAGVQVRTISLSQAEMKQLFGNQVVLGITGGLTSPTPVTVTPKQEITITDRLILTIRTGG